MPKSYRLARGKISAALRTIVPLSINPIGIYVRLSEETLGITNADSGFRLSLNVVDVSAK